MAWIRTNLAAVRNENAVVIFRPVCTFRRFEVLRNTAKDLLVVGTYKRSDAIMSKLRA